MLKTRILSSIIGIPLLFGLLYLGGVYWRLLFTLLALIALLEYLKMLDIGRHKPMLFPALLCLLVLLYSYLLEAWLPGLLFLVLVIAGLEFVLRYPRYSWSDLALSLFGATYIGFLLSFALRLSLMPGSFWIVVLCFLITWGSDIGGYALGRLIGKHKMTPQLSPNKTWEGALGGIILAMLLAGGLGYFINLPLGPGYLVLVGLGGSIAASLGDLLESGIKRYLGVKDSGRLIPGHGGVMDRFDSFLLVLPLIYLVFQFSSRTAG